MASFNSQTSPFKFPPEGKWTTEFYDYFEDRDNCLKACFCPCIIVGEIAEIIDGGTTTKQKACCTYACLPTWCKARYAAGFRRKLREMFNLPEEPYSDCFAHNCCCLCAFTQEYRELKNRGVDPSLGWQGNVEKWNREGLKAPPIPTHMSRC